MGNRGSTTHLHDSKHGTKRLFRHDLHLVRDIDQHLRRDIRRPFLCLGEIRFGDERLGAFRDCSGRGRAVTVVCQPPLVVVPNSTSSKRTQEFQTELEREGVNHRDVPASAMCSRMVAAERRLTTGPSVVSCSRGFPSLYPCALRTPPYSSVPIPSILGVVEHWSGGQHQKGAERTLTTLTTSSTKRSYTASCTYTRSIPQQL